MMVDAAEQIVIDHQGWIDQGSIWCLRVADDAPQRLELSDAEYLRLCEGQDDYFSVAHYFADGLRFVTVHTLASPGVAVARVSLTSRSPHVEGDTAAIARVPRWYTSYFGDSREQPEGYYLVRIDASGTDLQPLELRSSSDDWGYHSPLTPVEMPSGELAIPIQRSSEPLVYDPVRRLVVRRLSLVGRSGNPTIKLRTTAREAWAIDYDTVARFSLPDWHIKDSLQLQASSKNERNVETREFIGQWSFNRSDTLCAVARPFSGDVVALDTSSFQVVQRVLLGAQPLDVALLSDGQVIARDWKTGDLLRGVLAAL